MNLSSVGKILIVVSLILVLLGVCGGVSGEEDQASDAGNVRPVCRDYVLRWAPWITRKPYTSLLNNEFCPSWITRNYVNKKSQNTHLSLPKGLPFATFCGACYKGSTTLGKNLTISNTEYYEDKPVAQVSIKNREGELEYEAKNGHECLLEYGLTGPLQYSGEIKCLALLGKVRVEEPATYTVYDVPIETTKETIDVHTSTVLLKCPGHPDPATEGNPLIHIWYYPLATSPRIAAPTTNPEVTFRLSTSEPLVVSCATYHIMYQTKAVVTTYTVRRSESHQLQGAAILGSTGSGGRRAWDNGNSYGAYGEVAQGADGVEEGGDAQQASSAGVYFPSFMVAILSVTAAILAIIAIFASIKCIRGSKAR